MGWHQVAAIGSLAVILAGALAVTARPRPRHQAGSIDMPVRVRPVIRRVTIEAANGGQGRSGPTAVVPPRDGGATSRLRGLPPPIVRPAARPGPARRFARSHAVTGEPRGQAGAGADAIAAPRPIEAAAAQNHAPDPAPSPAQPAAPPHRRAPLVEERRRAPLVD
jgi:hypothetical protein